MEWDVLLVDGVLGSIYISFFKLINENMLRIKRTSGKVTNLYIVSSIPGLDKECVLPYIPNNFLIWAQRYK